MPTDLSTPDSRALLEDLERDLMEVLRRDLLQPHFQPIADLGTGEAYGFEGLIRGPSGTALHAPRNLFAVARACGLTLDLELACCKSLVRAFVRHGARGKLFLNVSPSTFTSFPEGFSASNLQRLGLTPNQVVIELTESEPSFSCEPLLKAAALFREQGFRIAMDDLGEGFSSLRLWSELRPDFVKVDKHFVQGVGFDPVKLQFLRSIRDLAHRTGTVLVAEGIETEADLGTLQDLGLHFGQGYLLGRPAPAPALVSLPLQFRDRSRNGASHRLDWSAPRRMNAALLMRELSPVAPDTPVAMVTARFRQEPGLETLPVVRDGQPVGLFHRHAFMELMMRPFAVDLFGKRACETLMEGEFLVVDHRTPLPEIGQRIVEADAKAILHGFLVTREGRYVGVGSGRELMREITQMQITAARYANPLTLLPGNVPICERMDDLLESGVPFVVAYWDLDHFKPYNDVHGYRKGDELIQWTARILQNHMDPSLDFLGHVGGDDFVMILAAPEWERLVQEILQTFEAGKGAFFSLDDLARGGYETEDRQGRRVLHALVSLSAGVLKVDPSAFPSHREVAAAASAAKKMAKRQPGSSYFVERRG